MSRLVFQAPSSEKGRGRLKDRAYRYDLLPERENYGVYFYCNNRLVVKELRTRDVGYFVSSESGVPHPDASLARVIVELSGSPELMPWNSSKSGINYAHPAFVQLRNRIIDFMRCYTKISRRLKNNWEEVVFPHTAGETVTVEPAEAESGRRTVLPKVPRTPKKNRLAELLTLNERVIHRKPWTLGLIESMGIVSILDKQRAQTKNRMALILLDSNFEIALKEYIVNRKDHFPAHKYGNKQIAGLFSNRTEVIKAIQPHAKLSQTIITKVNYYYGLRNSLIHERATTQITDKQIDDYNNVIESVLKKLFGVKFN